MAHSSAEAHKTRDHRAIQEWAKARGGHPATVRGTENGDAAGVLRLDFGEPDEKLEPISWDEFFEKFDKADLSFLYQDKTAEGHVSRFHKFVRQ